MILVSRVHFVLCTTITLLATYGVTSHGARARGARGRPGPWLAAAAIAAPATSLARPAYSPSLARGAGRAHPCARGPAWRLALRAAARKPGTGRPQAPRALTPDSCANCRRSTARGSVGEARAYLTPSGTLRQCWLGGFPARQWEGSRR